MREKKIALAFPKESAYISMLRMTSASVANVMRFSLDDIEDIKMCAAEAMLLSINEKNDEEETVVFLSSDKSLEIRVSGFLSSPEEESMSMQIISSLMDEVKFEDKFLVMTKTLRNDPV